MKKTQFSVLLFGILMICAGNLLAQTPKVWVTAGGKGAIGGNFLSQPENSLEQVGIVAPFDDGAGGIGGGGGIFGELRILKQHLGLEVDLIFDANKTWCTITYNNVWDVDFILKYTNLRIPVLVTGAATHGRVRLSAAVGPEFRVGLNADSDVASPDLSSAQLDSTRSLFSATKRNDVALAWELGMAIAAGPLEITVDLRFAHVLSLPKAYEDRVTIAEVGDAVNIDTQAGHSADGRIMLGVGYVFTAGK
ncbi:MAG: hypothetical protein JXX14_22070 [Deltaproteobacteria bacterium]|nr:hypothetical protein [Deltaproteobacteria bacterium]